MGVWHGHNAVSSNCDRDVMWVAFTTQSALFAPPPPPLRSTAAHHADLPEAGERGGMTRSPALRSGEASTKAKVEWDLKALRGKVARSVSLTVIRRKQEMMLCSYV